MDEFMTKVLSAGLLSSLRHDDAVARQGVMNHQNAAHLMDLAFIRDATELSIPESYAVQGLANSQTTREVPLQNLGHVTPSKPQ